MAKEGKMTIKASVNLEASVIQRIFNNESVTSYVRMVKLSNGLITYF